MQSWDTAIKITENNDFSVCSTWGILDQKYYLLDLHRERLNYPDLKARIKYCKSCFAPNVILIEDHGSGQSVIQDLQADGISNIKGVRHKVDKWTRFSLTMPLFHTEKVLFPKNDPLIDYTVLPELLNFPNSKYNDIVDSISQALHYMKDLTIEPLRIRNLF